MMNNAMLGKRKDAIKSLHFQIILLFFYLSNLRAFIVKILETQGSLASFN